MDNVDGMKQLDTESVDLTVTSHPYDKLRNYKMFSWDFESVARQLLRVTKIGGVVVWIVNDSTIKGSETGTSFRQALKFMETGFLLHDTMIYHKNNPMPQEIGKRYQPSFEYMFVLSKGRIKTFNPIKVPAIKFGKVKPKIFSSGNRQVDGTSKPFFSHHNKNEMKFRHNVWSYNVQANSSSKDRIAYKHPAIFPEELAKDHILSWSNIGDLVLDPFIGSGTTAKMARLTGRNFIGFEVSQEYVEIANERLGNNILGAQRKGKP